MNPTHNDNEDPRLAEILEVIFKFAAGDLTARATLSNDGSALDGVMAAINILGKELEASVAENRQAQQALSESEALLSTVFDSVQDGIVLVDAETWQFRMSNTSFQRMLGYSADEILELGVVDIHPKEAMDEVNREIARNIKREISFVPNIPVKRQDGSIFYTDINSSVMRVNETSFLLAVFTDITDRKQTVLTLRQSEHFLDTLLNAIPVPVFYKDREGRYLGFNKAYETFFGATRDQLIGKSVFDLSPPELAKIYHAKDTELFESREMQQYESQVKDSHGSLHDVIFSKAVFNDSQGVVNGLIGTILDISERKRAQQALAVSEALLRGVFDSVQDGIVVVDVQTQQYRMVNTAMCRMLGYSREEWLTMCVQDTHPKEALPRIAREFESLAKGDSTLAPALPMKRKDGSIFYADVNAGPMTINGVASVVGVFRDITERKQAEEEILKLNQALEEKVRQLLETQEVLEQHRANLEQEVAQRTASLTESQRIAHLGNWEWDVINNTVNWSDEMYRIFGYAPQQIGASYEAFLNAVHPEDRQLVDDTVREALVRQHTYSIEHRILQPDGTLRYVHGQAEVMQGEDGQTISMMGTLQDITERKLAEQTATDERNFSNTLIASQPDIFYVLDQTGRFIRWNDKLRDLLGYSDSQIAAANALDIIHEADRPSVAQKTRDTFEQGTAINVARLITKTGIRDFILTASRVDTANGAYAVGVGTDITERKQVEEKIRNLNEELEDKVRERTKQLSEAQEELVRKEKLAILGRISGSIGHELRNPLGVMSNAVYFLKMVLAEADEAVGEYLDIIKKEIDNSLRIITDLLDFARTKTPHLKTVNARALIDESLGRCTIPENVELQIAVPPALPPLKVDPAQMGQVLQNLIANGIQAMPTGGTLTIRGEQDSEGTVRLEVVDTGEGISPENMKKTLPASLYHQGQGNRAGTGGLPEPHGGQ